MLFGGPKMDELKNAYNICLKKIDVHMEKFPKAEPFGEYGEAFSGDYYTECSPRDFYIISDWMTSFVTGLAPLAFRTERDPKYLIWANQFRHHYHSKVFNHPLDTMHDIGFLYFPYSIAMYQLTGDEEHKKDALKAADELLKRFDIKGGYIDAWSRIDHEMKEGRAIVDCMMNVNILLWAWKQTGHYMYRDVAVAHIETTKKYFVRGDWSVAHSFLFDRKTGKMLCEANNCGYENGSHWARGTAWAVYGFALAAKYLDSAEYYETAMNIARKYLQEIGGDLIPIWDFRLPKDKPAMFSGRENKNITWDVTNPENRKYAVDTSAAAIISAGMMELMKFGAHNEFDSYVNGALCELCKNYINEDLSVAGMLKYQNGRNAITTYGDYFFFETLQMKLYNMPTCWDTF